MKKRPPKSPCPYYSPEPSIGYTKKKNKSAPRGLQLFLAHDPKTTKAIGKVMETWMEQSSDGKKWRRVPEGSKQNKRYIRFRFKIKISPKAKIRGKP